MLRNNHWGVRSCKQWWLLLRQLVGINQKRMMIGAGASIIEYFVTDAGKLGTLHEILPRRLRFIMRKMRRTTMELEKMNIWQYAWSTYMMKTGYILWDVVSTGRNIFPYNENFFEIHFMRTSSSLTAAVQHASLKSMERICENHMTWL